MADGWTPQEQEQVQPGDPWLDQANPETLADDLVAPPEPRVVILVPRRAGVGDRDRLWAFVHAWWSQEFPDWPIIEGHHDLGPFNRSAAINRASGLADWRADRPWDVAVIIDADVMCDPAKVREAVDLAISTGRMVLPFTARKDLDAHGTEKVLEGFRGNWTRYVKHVYTEMCSAVVVLRRQLWDDVGGFDESFVGWGFEDNAFAAACETFSRAPILKIKGELWHLWHATAKEGKRGTLTHDRNSRRADLYLRAGGPDGDPDAVRAIRATSAPSFDHRPQGIPRILHRVVPEATTEQVETWWRHLEELHPDWTFMTHRDPLDPADWPETSHKWGLVENGAQLADLLRLEALWRHGGIYLDSDFEPWRSLESLLPLSAFAAWEDHRTVPNAIMGAVPGHPAIRECLDLCVSRVPGPTWEAGPGVTTEVLPGRADVVLLPPGSFYPVHYRDPNRAELMDDPALKVRNPWAFGLHRYAGSWLDDNGRPARKPVILERSA